MQTSLLKKAQRVAVPAFVAMMAISAHAADEVLTDIEFVGLQRLTPESLYPLLTTEVGGVVTDQDLANSIQALYATGDFANIQAKQDEGRITYFVVERPIVAEVNFEGNKLIPKQGLEEGLKYAGISVGDVLKQSTVQNVANELQQQYISQGYYNSDIEVDQELLEGNRAKLTIRFIEGKPAKVVDINVIGNEYFSEDDIKDVFAVKESSWTRFLSKSDRYAKEKLAASLENLKAMYLNEGFVNFSVDNATLNINEEKNKVFIEVSVTEGEQYQFGEVSFLGKPSYDTAELFEQVEFQQGERFSQAKLEASTAALENHYGDDGFYFAQIRPVPRINEDTKTVDIDYFIDPARPVYVRRINFNGNIKTEDEVLRRELRQLEGALASSEKIQTSRVRLMRTGFFKAVNVDVRPVPNTPDQVDINFTVEEQPSGSSTIAAGYSQSGGVTFQLDFSQRNFMGTGNRVNAAFSRSQTRDSYSLGFTDPYFTANGVSQGLSAYYRNTKYDDRNVSNYVLDSYGATLSYSYPIDETKRISAGFNFDNTEVSGGRFMGLSNVSELLKEDGKMTAYESTDANGNVDRLSSASFKNDYNTYNLLLGWDYSTLDRPVFPTKGMSHDISATLGFGDQTYQKLIYRGNIYFPLAKDFVARGYAKLGYGNKLPFYENFYAGGYGSVRGYEASSLGPRSPVFDYAANGSSYPNGFIDEEEVGGNALATFGAELILPMPFKGDWADQVRPVIFVEGGQVFDTTDKKDQTFELKGEYAGYNDNLDKKQVPLLSRDDDLRYSAGAGITWFTPIGPISISYAKPFGDKEGDKTEEVQFQIGSTF
ncbi:outer membrane protein assembly factor BamA [Psychrobacter sp. FDAARGOS_221]|uniref:outer membrane protein assembly factor BamA n=1 Tax=Psychrobacter sp. FDAARGOS_221 TaxID=1975705 RepID=UPI000BB599C2|nr:outer membrane protein assembly factor BamA [Psychrobacter sp. FDAARGOS_221]PNK61375.1 outer membrane protein assembly factor BamA [Psychrobacter sp. FDAARGOS_221]